MLIYKGLNRVFVHDDKEKLKHLIENEYDETITNISKTNISYKIEKYLAVSGLSDILDIINSLISFFLIVFYIISTYTVPPNGNSTFITINNLVDTIEIFLCMYLVFHLSLRIYTSQNRLYFIFSFETLIDSGTIIVILLAKQSFVEVTYQYYFRYFRMVRIFYFFKLENFFQRRANETVRYIYKLVIYVVAIIFLSTGLILELENQAFRENEVFTGSSGTKNFSGVKGAYALYQFHDMFYYMLVTLGTIGFGDITPKTDLGRFTIIITILVMLATIPTLFQKLLTILALTSRFSRVSYNKSSKDNKHLILLGSCGKEGLDAFLNELYHEDHGNLEHHTVIMQSSLNEEMMKAIQENVFSSKLFYLVGNSLIHKDLKRCKGDSAECVVLLANKLAKDPKYEDFSNILQAFSVKKFAKIYAKKEMRICIQLLRPESKELYFSSLIDNEDVNTKDQVICVEELKLQLLGKSCLCPGINTIISSLITSKKPRTISDNTLLSPENTWLKEYLEGMQNEIYRVNMKASIVQGLTFIDFVKIIYEVSGLMVIGVDVIIDDNDPFLCLNPYNYIFSPFDHYVYVLAAKMPDSALINLLTEDYFKKRDSERAEVLKLLRIRNPSWEHMKKIRKEKEGGKKESENIGNEEERRKNKISRTKMKKLNVTRDFNDNFIRTVIPRTEFEAENFSHEILNNHIIVCGMIQNMKNLIYPLRATSMKNQQYPILIIDKEDHIPSEIWKEIQYYPDVYFMQGNPIKAKDLNRVGIKKAKAVIILTRNSSEMAETKEMIDADTIFIYKAIRNESKNILIIADLASINTIGFISSTDDSVFDNKEYKLSEQFAMGEIFTGSMLDTLMCQTFYNQYISDILQQLILGSAAFKLSNLNIHKLFDEKRIIQSTLYLLNIRDEMEKMGVKILPQRLSFQELFLKLVEKNMVPIGIFRNSKLNHARSISNNRNTKVEKYVYMVPSKDAEIDIEHDKIYVLSSGEDMYNNNQVEYKQKENIHQKNLKLIKESNKIANNIIDNLKSIINVNQESLRKEFSVKRIVDATRLSLRKEFLDVYSFAAKDPEEEKKEKSQLLEVSNIKDEE